MAKVAGVAQAMQNVLAGSVPDQRATTSMAPVVLASSVAAGQIQPEAIAINAHKQTAMLPVVVDKPATLGASPLVAMVSVDKTKIPQLAQKTVQFLLAVDLQSSIVAI